MTSPQAENDRPESGQGLRELVLGFCRQRDGIVDRPAYGVYDVLLPQEVASRLGVEPLQRLTFDPQASGEAGEAAFLHYAHPLIDRIVDLVRQETANARRFVNPGRLDPRDLFPLATRSLDVAGAHLTAAPNAIPRRALFHYLRFNFKVSLISDEKREWIVPVWMYLQGGHAVDGEEIERLAVDVPDPAYRHLDPAPATWSGESAPLAAGVLNELLQRARDAAVGNLAAGPLEVLQRRAERYLELDRARLGEYYDDLRADLEKRRRSAGDERRPALEDKLAAVESERRAKLTDVEDKYRLRVELELINVLVVVQPKLVLPLAIKKRKVAVSRHAVWDPVCRRVEPLLCEVCTEPTSRLWLCENGHLAGEGCLQPQCVDCGRVYCQRCSETVGQCAVCERPVCERSMVRCETCGRGTCREHVGACHQAEGAPAPAQPVPVEPAVPDSAPEFVPPEPATGVQSVLPFAVPSAPEPAASESPPSPPSPPKKARSSPASKAPATVKKEPKKARAKAGEKRGRAAPQRNGVRAQRIEVYVEMTQPVVTAYVLAGGRPLAVRIWDLVADGIRISCRCEKGRRCRVDGVLVRPEDAPHVEEQIKREIVSLREEYALPPGRVKLFRTFGDRSQPQRRLRLTGRWKDGELLARAQRAFDAVP